MFGFLMLALVSCLLFFSQSCKADSADSFQYNPYAFNSVHPQLRLPVETESMGWQVAPQWRLGMSAIDNSQQAAFSLSYTPFARFGSADNFGIGREDPLTFRVTIRGWELLETDTESGESQFMSLDRYREGNTRKQYIALSISKKF